MTVIQEEPELQFWGAEYRDLYARSDATLFQHPVWLGRIYGTLAPAVGAERLIITARDEDSGKLQFVLPLVRIKERRTQRVEFADLGVCDYAAPVIDRDANSVLSDVHVSRAVRDVLGSTDLVRIDKVVQDPTIVSSLVGARATRRLHYDTHWLTLDGTFDAWREALPPSFVRSLNKQRKRLGRNRRVVEMRELTSEAEVDAAFVKLREFRRARWADKRAIDLVQDRRYYEFYLDAARYGAIHGGPGKTTVLTVNDDVVAVSFALHDDNQEVGLLVGYDFENFRSFGLGLLFVESLIAAGFAKGQRVHDLGVGHGDYKKSFGAAQSPLYSVRAPLTVRGRVSQLVADQESAARAAAKRALAYQQRRFPKLDIQHAFRRRPRRSDR